MVRLIEVKKKSRDTSIELLRIVAMIMIVFHHFSVHSGYSFEATEITVPRLWLAFIQLGGKVGNDIFVLIAGYYLVLDNHGTLLNVKKIYKLWSQTIFYSLSILAIMIVFTNRKIELKVILQSFFPLASSLWWFASTYFVLYLLHRFINRMIYALNKREFEVLLIICIMMWCLAPTFINFNFGSTNITWFFTLYLIAAYFRLYFRCDKKIYFSIACVSSLIFTYLATFGFMFLGTKFSWLASRAMYFYNQDKLNVLVIAASVFLLFKSIDVKQCKIINKIASATFGVYLIHENPLIREVLWQHIFQKAAYINSIYIIIYSIYVCVITYIVCTIIELLRIKVMEITVDQWVMPKISVLQRKISLNYNQQGRENS